MLKIIKKKVEKGNNAKFMITIPRNIVDIVAVYGVARRSCRSKSSNFMFSLALYNSK